MKLHYFIQRVKMPIPLEYKDLIARLAPSLRMNWWNGYVCLPAGHPCHSMNWMDIHEVFELEVHGGLTFSQGVSELADWEPLQSEKVNPDDWIVGFDTAHAFDNDQNQDMKFIRKETRNLARQFEVIQDAFQAVDWRKYL